MQIGSWALIQETPSLMALLPLLVFIVLSFKKNVNMLFPVLCGILVGWILTGNTPSTFGQALLSAMSSSLGVVGMLVMLAGGLGAVLNQTGISLTICKTVIQMVGMKSTNQALLALMLCQYILTFCIGSFASASAIILPVFIPLLGIFHVTPAAAVVAVLLSGNAGLLLIPFGSYTVMGMNLTGLTYQQYFLYGGLPFALILMISGYFSAVFIQKKTTREGAECYSAEAQQTNLDISDASKSRTVAFLVVFVAIIIYTIVARKSMSFVLVVLPFLAAVAAALFKMDFNTTANCFCDGCKRFLNLFFCLLLYELIIEVIDLGGGFDALGNLLISQIGDKLTPTTTMILAMLVGAFGIGGDKAAQMQIIQSVFAPMVQAVGLNMKCWIIVLLGGPI